MTDFSGEARLERCQEAIGYRFRDTELLQLALTHASDKSPAVQTDGNLHPSESISACFPRMLDNERLEFLGDSVLGVIVCETLFADYPAFSEGELTAIKSVVVSQSVLAEVSVELGLPECMWLGKGMVGHDRLPRSMQADVFEAIVGAVYLDGGIEAARTFVLERLAHQIKLVESNKHRRDYKSMLQQYTQRRLGCTPTYRVVAEEGPDHVKRFEVVAMVRDKSFAPGQGTSKKEAEQHAAENAYRALTNETPPDDPEESSESVPSTKPTDPPRIE